MSEVIELVKKHTAEVKRTQESYDMRIHKVEKNMTSMAHSLRSIEQGMPRNSISGEPMGTLGTRLIGDDAVKGFLTRQATGQRVGIETRAILTNATTDADGSVGDMITPYRDRPVPLAKRGLTIRNLVPIVQVDGNGVEYPRVKAVNNNAASQAGEGAAKAESDMQVELVSVPIRTIAHYMLASRQVLDDAPQLRDLVDGELLYGLKLEEEDQLLNGDGNGHNLNGIYTQATAFSAGGATIANPNQLDAILYAALQISLADFPATGIVLHPSDWTAMRGLKDADGKYLLGDPGDAAEPRLFGLPVVATKAMTAGDFLVGDFAGCATIYDRWQARIEISTEDSDNFRKNLVTLLAEERIGMTVKRTAGFVKGTFSAAISALTPA